MRKGRREVTWKSDGFTMMTAPLSKRTNTPAISKRGEHTFFIVPDGFSFVTRPTLTQMPRSRVRIFQFRKIFGNLCLENRDKDDERKQIHENNNKIHLSYFCGVRRHPARARRSRSCNGPSITTKETTIQQRAIAAYSSKAYRSTGHARGRIATGLLWSRRKMDLASCDLKLSQARN
jgi:hypothetical protein